MTAALSNPFDGAPIISSYSRAQAIEDGMLVDAQQGDLAEVSRQHVGSTSVAMTAGVFALIEKAVKHPRQMNDWRGVWHDVLWMSQVARRVSAQRGGSPVGFKVIITGTGRVRNHVLFASYGPGDAGEPVVTIMLAEDL
jgi:hypothetical protein